MVPTRFGLAGGGRSDRELFVVADFVVAMVVVVVVWKEGGLRDGFGRGSGQDEHVAMDARVGEDCFGRGERRR